MKKALLELSLVVYFLGYAKQPMLLDELPRPFQVPESSAPADAPRGTTQPTDFRTCSQLVANAVPPVGPDSPRLNPQELCDYAFAIFCSGSSKTPVIVAERLVRAQLDNDK